ncbi:hypothetical protein [Diaphorobacter aerolatus]|uniref:Uncharacterized protein n=1 Tax=Diaphorobacter aerolatus TaxID=1288495 RepID=A0A7H0GKF4_9BURK|nr:hypothetical protein [Diaphorobacter aerolatus]QNP48770.1 hypothetical protein H9K75_00535 [Diaphorobacter aerolatus]
MLTEQHQLKRQQERERALRQSIEKFPDVLDPSETTLTIDVPENEIPCFNIHRLDLKGENLQLVSRLASAGLQDFISCRLWYGGNCNIRPKILSLKQNFWGNMNYLNIP